MAAVVSLPGGCSGRAVDLHLARGSRRSGRCSTRDGYGMPGRPGSWARAFAFPTVSVGATENLLIAAPLAKGDGARKPASPRSSTGAVPGDGWARGSMARGPSGLDRGRRPALQARPIRSSPTGSSSAPTCWVPAITGGEVRGLSAGGRRWSRPCRFRWKQPGSRSGDRDRALRVAAERADQGGRCPHPPASPAFRTDLQQMMALLTPSRQGEPSGRSDLREPLHACRPSHAGWARGSRSWQDKRP